SSVWFFCRFFVGSGKGRSSFFNRAVGVKKVVHSGLRRIVSARWWHAIGEMLFHCSAEGRFFVPACRPICKTDTSAVLGQACPGSEQEGPARVAPCPHERRSGARGRCLFAHRGKPGWHS